MGRAPKTTAARRISCATRMATPSASSCQLCEFVCPPKAIKIIPPGPAGPLADRPNAEKMPRGI